MSRNNNNIGKRKNDERQSLYCFGLRFIKLRYIPHQEHCFSLLDALARNPLCYSNFFGVQFESTRKGGIRELVSLLNKLGINDKDELLITNLTNFVRINFHDVTILHFLRN